MTDYVVRDTQLTSIADAIRAKGSTSAPISFPDGFVSAVQAFPDTMTLDSLSVTENGVYTPSSGHAYSEVTVDVSGSGGGTDAEDGIITRTISGNYTNERVTQVGSYAFYMCSGLTTVSFPACTTISTQAFYACSSLNTVNFPTCTTIGNSAFHACIRLTTVNFPVCTTIGAYAFDACSRLTTVSFPACTSIGGTAFYGCSSLTTVNFPVCTSIGGTAFNACSRLTTVSFPVCVSIGNSAFSTCYKLSTVNFPACTSIGAYAFYSCYSLTTVSFPACTSIGSYAFAKCFRLISAYFLGSSVPNLTYSNAYSTTPIAGYSVSTGGVLGSIFVRASLLTAFQSATNWSFFSERMVGLTDEEIAALDNNS